MFGFLFFVFILLISQTASSDKTEELAQEIQVDESTSYAIEAREKEEPIMVMEIHQKPPEDRMCDTLDEIIEILGKDGVAE